MVDEESARALCFDADTNGTLLPLDTRSDCLCLRIARRLEFDDLDRELEREVALERLELRLLLEYELELEDDVDDDDEYEEPEE